MFKKKRKLEKKIVSILAISVVAVFLFALIVPNVLAAIDPGLDQAAQIGLSGQDIRITIAKIIRIVIGFLGIIAVGLIMYAGWLWMSSEGDEEKVNKAKLILKNAVIGLIIILSSFAIASFILNKLTGGATGGTGTGGGPGGGGGGIAALGSGIIESHYPGRNQQNVPRNTKIIISFKEPIDPTTIITNNKMNIQNVKIYKSADGLTGPAVSDVTVSKSADNKTFVFKPVQYLGNSRDKIWYSVALSKNIKKLNGDLAFGKVLGEFPYDWTFEVSAIIDIVPPQIQSIVPQPNVVEPRNIVIQINLNEAIDPSGINNIIVKNVADNAVVDGNFYLSNQYRTFEFLTNDKCGENSCGLDVYCLPGNKDLSVLVKAATLAVVGEPSATFPYDGVVDMADNSLDGNKDGKAQGPKQQSALAPYNENNPNATTQGDDYTWSFKTSNVIDTSPPTIIRVEPNIGASAVTLSSAVEAEFDKLMMSNSLNSNSLNLVSDQAINYWINSTNSTTTNSAINKITTVIFNHDQFNEEKNYSPKITSGVKDVYQNCFFPCSGLNVNGNPSCCDGTATASSSCP